MKSSPLVLDKRAQDLVAEVPSKMTDRAGKGLGILVAVAIAAALLAGAYLLSEPDELTDGHYVPPSPLVSEAASPG